MQCRRQRGEEVYLQLIPDLGTRCGERSASRPDRTLALGKGHPDIHCTGGWVGLRAGLNTEARGIILYLYRGPNPGRPG
jgi:hypothetical protein